MTQKQAKHKLFKPVSSSIATAPSIIVKDAYTNVVPGTSVTFAIATGGGTLTGISTSTNGSGIATVGSWTLGPIVGSNTMTATSAGLAGSPIIFAATGTVAQAHIIAINTGNNQSAIVSSSVATAPSVIIRDLYTNVVPNTPATFSVTFGGGLVTGNMTTTNVSGIATVGSWKMGAMVGINTLSAASAGLSGSPQTFYASGTVGTANQLSWSVQPNLKLVTNIPQQIPSEAIQVQDAYGNPVYLASGTISLFLHVVQSSETASLYSGSDIPIINGTATFTDMYIGADGGYWLTSSTSIGSVSILPDSNPFTVSEGPPTQISSFAGNNQSTSVSQSVAIAPTVYVRDQYGNHVSPINVIFAVVSGGGSIMGSSTIPTDVFGKASGSWTLGTIAGINTLAVSGSRLNGTPLDGSPVIFTALCTAGTPSAASSSVLAGGSQVDIVVNHTASVAPSVILKDDYGNAVPNIPVNFAVILGGGSVMSGLTSSSATTISTGNDGIAQLTGWKVGTKVGLNILLATIITGSI